MQVTVGFDGCGREVPRDFQRRLDEFNRHREHELKLVWNPKGRVLQRPYMSKDGQLVEPVYAPRWDIWVRWAPYNHPLNRGTRKVEARLLEDGRLWVRLCSWEWPDGSYADPFSEVFFRAAQVSDSQRDTRKSGPHGHFDDQYGTDVEAYSRDRARLVAPLYDAAKGSIDYMRSLDKPIVGRHVSSGWRHKLPHR
jgi:hypothetical protein